LVPSICGFTTHRDLDYILWLPGQKSEYRGEEVRGIPLKPDCVSIDGSLSLLRDKKEVVVKLDQGGVPFGMNGIYHYH
jgi:hypothetical protein